MSIRRDIDDEIGDIEQAEEPTQAAIEALSYFYKRTPQGRPIDSRACANMADARAKWLARRGHHNEARMFDAHANRHVLRLVLVGNLEAA
jgi:hypothetical protein